MGILRTSEWYLYKKAIIGYASQIIINLIGREHIPDLIIGCVFECDLYWSGEVGCGTSITLKTGRDDWRGQTKHEILRVFANGVKFNMCAYNYYEVA